MVAFFEKPTESDGFHEIIDFLNANQIHYALTINPIIYTSCIEQFWATVKANTVNGDCQLQALVDKKRVIIMESSIRSDLQLADVGGIDCLPTATIFEELARIGAKTTAWNEFSSTMASAIICLSINQKFNFYKYIFDAMVLDLETTNDTQAKEIAGLKKRVQKLERKKKSRTTGLKRLRKVGESSRVESSKDKESLGAQEVASKQGRIKIVDETQGRLDDAEMFEIDDLHDDEVFVDMAVGEKQEKSEKINEREVSTGVEDSATHTILATSADEGVTAAKIDEITPTSAPTTVIDELTLAQTLIKIKAAKPKAVITAAITTTTRTKARELFEKEMKRVNSFVAMNSEVQKISGKKDERSSNRIEIAQDSSAKRAGDKLEFDESKKQKTDENEEVEEDNEAELKKHLVIVKDDDITTDAIPLASKPPVIVEYKLIREGIMAHYKLIRADGSSKRYSSMIRMLQAIDREDLETLWKLVKTKHGNTRPEDEHERVLWGDLKIMFEPDIKSDVWRNLHGYKVTIWKLYDSCGLHFVRGGLLGLKDFKMILRVTAAQ
ncbi:hypothetical protein Tco_1008642, partial [Tanacetum coccineum]